VITIGTTTYTWSDAATGRTAVIHFPKLAGGGVVATTVINADLAAAARSNVTDWRKNLDPAPAMPETPDDLTGEFTIAKQTESVVSFRLAFMTMISGAAHPSAWVHTRTYDIASGKRYELGDLFTAGSDYLTELSSQSRMLLRTSLSEDSLIDAGTEPSADNFAGWALVPDGLEITFAQYQVAPYALGMPVIVIDPVALGDLVNPDGPLAAAP
jgi:hypothetical protein